jgi:hypothetical protein
MVGIERSLRQQDDVRARTQANVAVGIRLEPKGRGRCPTIEVYNGTPWSDRIDRMLLPTHTTATKQEGTQI